MFHNWSHPQTFCRHQTVPETYHKQLVQTTTILLSICKTYIFWHTGVKVNKKSFISIDSRDHNNTHQLTNIASAVDVYHSFLT